MTPSGRNIVHHERNEVGEAFVAIVTPFTAGGQVDEEALRVYLQNLYQSNIRDVVVNGTTGEFWAMTLEERQRTEDGQMVADAALLLPPFYYERAPAGGVSAFLEAALAHAKLPVILYNYPRHCSNVIGPAAFEKLRARFPLLQGKKNSEMPLADCAAYSDDSGAAVLIGTEDLVQALDRGFHGFVTGGAWSVFPSVVEGVLGAHRGGNVDGARILQRERLDPWVALVDAMQCEAIAATKGALSEFLPSFSPAVRPLLLPAGAADMQAIREFVQRHVHD
ncbi:hypothetical protein WJX81_005922 [Elliptochloris bilobata]|uniref:Dihydrodipicolinate synthase family protein n=1 Tax=Elliptochloris bilobata TaxID=381761 RepID=A0AAW1RE99_9CHLO